MRCMQFIPTVTRRDMLRASACGMGQLALAAMAGRQSLAENPIGPRLPARAKRVIFLFMWGGPSHVDLFDPKPVLQRLDGQPLAGKSVGIERDQLGNLLGSPFRFKQHGQSGTWMSELLPHLSTQADRMCVIRSMHTEGNAHGEALLRLPSRAVSLENSRHDFWVVLKFFESRFWSALFRLIARIFSHCSLAS